MTRIRHAAVLLLLLVVALQAPALAQFGDPHTQVTVVLESKEVKPGEPVRGIFHLKMEDGWHTYWKNAGDVGLPTEAKWTLPTGWKAGPLLFPAPHYLETSGLISYAYEDEVSLAFELTPEPTATAPGPLEVAVNLSWLECEKSCVPASADLKFGFAVGAATVEGEGAAQVKAAFEALPKPRTDIQASLDGPSAMLLHIPADIGGPEASFRFFPDSMTQIAGGAPQEVVSEEGARYL